MLLSPEFAVTVSPRAYPTLANPEEARVARPASLGTILTRARHPEEKTVAIRLYGCGLTLEYEPRKFELGPTRTKRSSDYIPDFGISGMKDVYIEVTGSGREPPLSLVKRYKLPRMEKRYPEVHVLVCAVNGSIRIYDSYDGVIAGEYEEFSLSGKDDTLRLLQHFSDCTGRDVTHLLPRSELVLVQPAGLIS